MKHENTIKEKAKKKTEKWKNRLFGKVSFFVVFLFLLAGVPVAALAEGETLTTFILAVVAAPIYGYMMLVGGILWICGFATSWLLNASFDVVNYLPVTVGWQTTRDVLNLFVVLFLLVIIFATIFRVESYYKNLLPKLVLAIILVNFSRTISSILIEISNVLTRSLMPAQLRGNFTETMLASLGLRDFWDIPPGNKFDTLDAFAGLLFNAVLFSALMIAFLGITLMFFFRLIVLMMLTILSPVAFLFNVLPATKKFSDMWWESFIKWLWYGPIVSFFLLLALRVAQAEKDQIIGQSVQNYKQPFVQEGSMASIIVLILVITLIFTSLVIGQKLGLFGAKASMQLSKWGGSFLGRTGPGLMKNIAGKRRAAFGAIPGFNKAAAGLSSATAGISKSASDAMNNLRENNPRLDKAMSYAGGTLLGKVATSLPKVASMAGAGSALTGDFGQLLQTATTLPQAIMARMARNEKEHYGPATGYTHDLVNQFWGEQTKFGSRADKDLAAQKQKEMAALTSPEQMQNILGANSFPEAFAAFMQAAADNNLNDAASLPQLFNQHRDALIETAQADHIFSPGGEEALNDFLNSSPNKAQYLEDLADPEKAGAARAAINKEWAASSAHGKTFKDSFAVTDTSAPVFSPTIMKKLMHDQMIKLGGTEDQAVSAISDISEMMGNKGNWTSYGMTTRDGSTGKLRMSTKEEQADAIEDKRRKIGSRKFMESMHSNTVSMESNGEYAGSNEFADVVMRDFPGKILKELPRYSREDMRDSFMSNVTIGGKEMSVADYEKQRILAEVDGTSNTSELARLKRRAAQLKAKGTPKANRSRAQIMKKIDAHEERMAGNLGALLAIEYVQTGKATDFGGTEIVDMDETKALQIARDILSKV